MRYWIKRSDCKSGTLVAIWVSCRARRIPRADLKRPWAAVTKAAGIEGVRLHDFGILSPASVLARQWALPIIGKLLGHSQAATTHRYAHLDAEGVARWWHCQEQSP
jgi:integrase